MAEVTQDSTLTESPESPDFASTPEADLPQSSTQHPIVSNTTPPEEVPTRVKKPRKPRPPKIVAKLATVAENSTPGPPTDVAILPKSLSSPWSSGLA